MSIASHPVIAIADHLILAGRVLACLENGRMPMHAADYREISGSMSAEFMQLETPTLKSLWIRLPPSLQAIVENVLYLRADRDWQSPGGDHSPTESAWAALHTRLRQAR